MKLSAADVLELVQLAHASGEPANLQDKDLSADLAGARYDRYTRWSVTFDPVAAGAVLVGHT